MIIHPLCLAVWLYGYMAVLPWGYQAKGYRAMRTYGKAMMVYNSLAISIAKKLHSYMAIWLQG